MELQEKKALYHSKFISQVNQPIQHLLPKAPVNLTSSNVTSTSVDLAWDSVEQADGYNVYQDGVVVDTVTTNNYNVTGLTTATTYEFYVTATIDKYGTESEQSDTVSVTTT
ncbi:fibronectin type III domain-containing protein [Virgibacillus subterraneus]|uniref:fibronectin type III domain-containing protein n=1 Tax=Virgibacillus subterraneus TaxID=621109 RepID=UPI002481C3D7|nr:fibronectin type III domain-containing protein [Virgibacillus subterraneus]